jgi:hypothetical protein
MNYTVIWLPDAEQELAALWLAAADRARVTRAAHLLDQRLRRDPENEGESRSGLDRIIIEAPLVAHYRVRADDRIVEVGHAWRF